MKVLYLSLLIPSPGGSGGKLAVYNHLLEVLVTGASVKLVAVDQEGVGTTAADIDFPGECVVNIYPRALPRNGTLRGRIRGMLQLFLDLRPRAVAVVSPKAARRAVREALDVGGYDLVIVDHLNSWGLVEGARTAVPIQYIAHNIESDVIKDQLLYERGRWLERLRLCIEFWKTRRYERVVLRHASDVTLIASTDAKSPIVRSASRTARIWPELPARKAVGELRRNRGELLFVGSARYFPNREAIEWLVRDFMPKLLHRAPDVRLRIAGTSMSDVPHLNPTPNVAFEGFVSDGGLDVIYRTATLFVCPVVLGSGVKIKVLEATSYGLPVAAVAESLRGIEYLDGSCLRFVRDGAVESIVDLLMDESRLESMARNSLAQLDVARNKRPPLMAPGLWNHC